METEPYTHADFYRQVISWLSVLGIEHEVCPFPFSYIEFDFLSKRLAGETAYLLIQSNFHVWQNQ